MLPAPWINRTGWLSMAWPHLAEFRGFRYYDQRRRPTFNQVAGSRVAPSWPPIASSCQQPGIDVAGVSILLEGQAEEVARALPPVPQRVALRAALEHSMAGWIWAANPNVFAQRATISC